MEQRGLEPLASALRTTKFKFYGPPKKHMSFVISPNKNAAANKIPRVMNCDHERPILTKFGNVLATRNGVNPSVETVSIGTLAVQ